MVDHHILTSDPSTGKGDDVGTIPTLPVHLPCTTLNGYDVTLLVTLIGKVRPPASRPPDPKSRVPATAFGAGAGVGAGAGAGAVVVVDAGGGGLLVALPGPEQGFHTVTTQSPLLLPEEVELDEGVVVVDVVETVVVPTGKTQSEPERPFAEHVAESPMIKRYSTAPAPLLNSDT